MAPALAKRFMTAVLRFVTGGRIRRRAIVTVTCVLLYRAGQFKRLPGAPTGGKDTKPLGDVMDFLLPFSEELTVPRIGVSAFQLGITPFISASIIVQVLSSLETVREYRKEDADEATEALKQLTRLLCFLIAIYQARDVVYRLVPVADLTRFNGSAQNFFWDNWALLMSGACMVAHLAERITEQGIGQGPSIFISISILSGYASSATKLCSAFVAGSMSTLELAACLVAFLGFVIGAVLLTGGVVKVPMVFFQSSATSVPGVPRSPRGKDDHIPFRINPLSMQPVLIALYALQIPQWVLSLAPSNPALITVAQVLQPGGAVYYVLLFTIIFASTFIDFEDFPREINEYMVKIGARVPHVRPGARSIEYFRRIQNGARFWGGTLLGGLATLAVSLDHTLAARHGTNFGLTSTLILVSTVLQIRRQVLSLREDPRLSGDQL